MARLVTKFKFLKSGDRKGAGGYAKYIATREGVERIDDSQRLAPATKQQETLIEKILKDFPDSATLMEYADYQSEPNMGNASEFIFRAIEDNADDLLSSKTYADYIATRPRAQRFGSHGLFTDDGVRVQLEKVSEELNLHEGNVWTAIISLRREDAERLGFNSGERWRDMLRAHTHELSDAFHIPMTDLKWFAAFHNEGHHPHVHLMIYSANPKEGYLSPKGVEHLRSSLAKEIFAQDLFSVYEKQTEHRNELRMQSKELIAGIVAKINGGTYDNPVLEQKLSQLAEKLSRTSGKKVYGYLKADVKDLVDSIVDEVASDRRIAVLYDLWYEQREEVIRTYTENLPERVPLSQNNEFKSVRNAVIQEAMGRVTWNIRGKRRIVWRCISRLDYGKKYCTESITVDEQALQRAIVRALNRFNVEDEATYLLLMKSTIGEAVGINGSSDEIDLLERRIDALNKRMLDLVSLSVQEGDDAENHEDDFKNISTQIEQLTKRITAIRESESENGDFQARLKEIQDIIDKRRENKDIYDDSIVRQMVECIKVYHDGRLQIILGGGYELEEYLEK